MHLAQCLLAAKTGALIFARRTILVGSGPERSRTVPNGPERPRMPMPRAGRLRMSAVSAYTSQWNCPQQAGYTQVRACIVVSLTWSGRLARGSPPEAGGGLLAGEGFWTPR